MQSPNGRRLLSASPHQLLVALTIVSSLLCSGVLSSCGRSAAGPSPTSPTPSIADPTSINAVGRLEPREEVINVSAPAAAGGSNRVAQLLVREGDKVRAGQVLAILDSRDSRQAALERAEQQVNVAQAQLAQVRAGAKAGEINAQVSNIARLEAELRGAVTTQKATVARLQAELSNAQLEYRRYQDLYQSGAISASVLDSRRLTVDTAQQQLNETKANLGRTFETLQNQVRQEKATLNQIAEVRPTDVQAAQAEVDSTIAAVKQAKADLALSYVRAPRSGQIIKIYAWAGEVIGNTGSDAGILSMGQTSQMYVVAEVFQSDITKVRLRQSVTITSSAFPDQTLKGTVDQIGLQIAKRDVLDTDPAADQDVRVVEVKVRLDAEDSQKVAGLTNLNVDVKIAI